MRKYRTTYTPRSVRHTQNKARNRIIISIIVVLFLGYASLTWGLPALIGGLTYITHFNSKPAVKVASTDDLAITPPVLNIPFESTNSASLTISGYSTPDTKVEIYFDDELKTTASVSDDGSFSTDPLDLVLGTNNIYGKTIVNDKKSLDSKTIKVIYNNDKPKLDVTSPTDNQEVHGGDKKIHVEGSTGSQDTITINGTTVIVNGDGHFGSDININDGDNTITIVATNEYGNTTSVTRQVKYSSS